MKRVTEYLVSPFPEDTVLRKHPEFVIALESRIPTFVDQDWPERVVDFETWLVRMFDLREDGPEAERRQACVRARWIMTALLEAVPGIVVDCLDAAMLVRFSTRDSWKIAAMRWLSKEDGRAIDTWIDAHPGYRAALADTITPLN